MHITLTACLLQGQKYLSHCFLCDLFRSSILLLLGLNKLRMLLIHLTDHLGSTIIRRYSDNSPGPNENRSTATTRSRLSSQPSQSICFHRCVLITYPFSNKSDLQIDSTIYAHSFSLDYPETAFIAQTCCCFPAFQPLHHPETCRCFLLHRLTSRTKINLCIIVCDCISNRSRYSSRCRSCNKLSTRKIPGLACKFQQFA